MVRLQPAQYLELLLTAHAAEDAFDPLPEDEDDEGQAPVRLGAPQSGIGMFPTMPRGYLNGT